MIYLSIRNNRKDKAFLIQQYEVLEAYANSLNIKLYCRDLYLLVHDANLFITSFRLQDLPYSYYTYENKVQHSPEYKFNSLQSMCHHQIQFDRHDAIKSFQRINVFDTDPFFFC